MPTGALTFFFSVACGCVVLCWNCVAGYLKGMHKIAGYLKGFLQYDSPPHRRCGYEISRPAKGYDEALNKTRVFPGLIDSMRFAGYPGLGIASYELLITR